ncbi:3-oxoacid CoA-transferase subunit B [Nisaea acidiphila]|uniref:3-oxoacid CoA-transferase subunit B n=1 Tax=Nisaea acidiphila TaxID=1862145 RepID=A0A9J7AVW3_9PROT|nr:3-oxoacid CoA-transferase subunit B [Nisaea acidiphila]UUX49565.1 3-oxoacid CoA-transferase subunit B [Nisaea acidiphila]
MALEAVAQDEAVKKLTRNQVAWRAANEIPDGSFVNLGIGLPTTCANFMPEDREIVLHSENGILGVGPAPAEGEEDPELINASKDPITLVPGGSFFVHSDAFVMIRGGHIDLALLGAFEISADGDLANWTTENPNFPPGVGGAMDLAAGAKQVWVLTDHVTRKGAPKIVNKCSYPLTAQKVVTKIFTDLAVIDVAPDGLVVREMVEGMTLEALQELTEPKLTLAPDCKVLTAPAL